MSILLCTNGANAGMHFLPDLVSSGVLSGGDETGVAGEAEYNQGGATGESRFDKYACGAGEYESLAECNDNKAAFESCVVNGYCYVAVGSCGAGEYEDLASCNSAKSGWETCSQVASGCYAASGSCPTGEYEVKADCDANKGALETCTQQSNECWKPVSSCLADEYSTLSACDSARAATGETCKTQTSGCYGIENCSGSPYIYGNEADCLSAKLATESCQQNSSSPNCWGRFTSCGAGEYDTLALCESAKETYESCNSLPSGCYEIEGPTNYYDTMAECDADKSNSDDACYESANYSGYYYMVHRVCPVTEPKDSRYEEILDIFRQNGCLYVRHPAKGTSDGVNESANGEYHVPCSNNTVGLTEGSMAIWHISCGAGHYFDAGYEGSLDSLEACEKVKRLVPESTCTRTDLNELGWNAAVHFTDLPYDGGVGPDPYCDSFPADPDETWYDTWEWRQVRRSPLPKDYQYVTDPLMTPNVRCWVVQESVCEREANWYDTQADCEAVKGVGQTCDRTCVNGYFAYEGTPCDGDYDDRYCYALNGSAVSCNFGEYPTLTECNSNCGGLGMACKPQPSTCYKCVNDCDACAPANLTYGCKPDGSGGMIPCNSSDTMCFKCATP